MLSGFTLTLLRQRHFALAEPLQRSLLEMHRRVHGLGHKDTLTAAADLAVALSEQAKYAEAEAMFAEVLPEMQRMYGDADLSTLNAVRGLALAKLCQGKQVHQCCDATWWWLPRAVIGSRLLPFFRIRWTAFIVGRQRTAAHPPLASALRLCAKPESCLRQSICRLTRLSLVLTEQASTFDNFRYGRSVLGASALGDVAVSMPTGRVLQLSTRLPP
jgi:hypothetical protein